MVKEVIIETQSFKTQTVAMSFFREILYRYDFGAEIPDPDHSDLVAVVVRHPEATQKIGSGISRFSVMKANQGTRCFCLHRTDGSSTDFSIKTCVTGKGPTRFQEVSSALRIVVSPDIHARRDFLFAKYGEQDGTLQCAASGIAISRDQGHMDHRPPMTFQVIVRTFLAANNLVVEDLDISESRDHQFTASLEDLEVAEKFREYHKLVANLDFVAKEINLSQSSKHRIKSARN